MKNEIATAPSKRPTQVSHVVSIVVLALRLNATKSAVGISLKTQELYLIVFVARYADLFSHFYSLYNTFMKIAFITRNGRRRVFPLLLAAGATIPSETTNPYLRKVAAAGGFKAYEKAHRQALATKFAAKAFPRLPTDVAAQVVAFAFHVGYY